MKSDFRVFVSSRFLRLLVLSSIFTRLYFQFILLSKSPSDFGPDEGTYAALAKYVADGSPVDEFPEYGPNLYNNSKSFIIPSSALIRVGINDLLAVRIISTLAGLLSLIMLSLCLIAFHSLIKSESRLSGFKLEKSQRLILVIFAFLPSNFLWSNLGLRESSSQLFLISFTYFSLKLLSPAVSRRLLYSILSGIALIFAFGTRPETAIVFWLLASIFGVILSWKLRQFWIVLPIFIGYFGGQAFTTTPAPAVREVFDVIKVTDSGIESTKPSQNGGTGSSAPIKVEINKEISILCSNLGEILNTKNGQFICIKSKSSQATKADISESAKPRIPILIMLESKRNLNRLGAESALPESSCYSSNYQISRQILCNMSEFSYRFPTFLFRPFPIIDSGSNSLNLAALENLIWLSLISYALYSVINKRLDVLARFFVLWLYSYLTAFSIAASLYEGNLGTAFRHKSSILWALTLGLLILHKDFRSIGIVSNSFKYRHSKEEDN